MQKLSEMDSSFLQQETARTPMHISPVLIYDQSARRDHPVRFDEILTTFERNLHKSAIFRRKLAGGAFGLDTPYWVEDPDFDLEFHVRQIALPQPGDWRQLCVQLARLHARGLDMRRPLWEAYVIEGLNKVEGLPEHSFAIMLKVHHSAIDGISGAEIVTAIHSLTDEIVPPTVED
ncbi:MAG: wax ester/triacylglycerol synthase domain-containing protein, partial [Halioglobus sp.]